MKITREGNWQGALLANLGGSPEDPEGSEPPPSCCDPGADPPNRAGEDTASAVSLSTPTTDPGIVQKKASAWVPSGVSFDVVLDDAPTVGNELAAYLFTEDGSGSVSSSGWTLTHTGTANANQKIYFYTKTAGVSESDTVSVASAGGGVSQKLVVYEINGTFDDSDFTEHASKTSPLVAPTLTPSSSPGVLLAAFSGHVASYAGNPTWTPQGALVQDYFERNSGARGVAGLYHEDTTTGSYSPSITTTALYSNSNHDETVRMDAVYNIGAASDAEWIIPAPKTIDGDDTTAERISGPQVLRVDLGAAFRILRVRVRMGTETAGARTYRIRGANAADFSDVVVLGTADFTATGSYTAQDVEFSWFTTESYRFFQLNGNDETRDIFTFEAFEPVGGQNHTHDDLVTDAELADLKFGDLDDVDMVTTPPADGDVPIYNAATDTWLPGANSNFLTTTAGGGDVISTVAAAGTTETLDLDDGNVHDVTLTDDCTFTFTSPAAGAARSFTLLLRQGAGFPHLATWPGSVVWAGGSAPTLSTGSGDVDILTFFTLDGGTVWYGFATGGGSAVAALDDLTDVTITTPAADDTLRYVSGEWVNDDRRWEPVTTDPGTGPEIVFTSTDIVMTWESY